MINYSTLSILPYSIPICIHYLLSYLSALFVRILDFCPISQYKAFIHSGLPLSLG
jgi:hypothetical protein